MLVDVIQGAMGIAPAHVEWILTTSALALPCVVLAWLDHLLRRPER